MAGKAEGATTVPVSADTPYARLLVDVAAEYRALDDFIVTLADAAWLETTPFFDWSVRDQVLHLFQVDRFGLTSLGDPEGFADLVKRVRADQAEHIELSEQVRREVGDASRADVMDRWRSTYRALLAALAARDAKDRMTWFGPPMGLMSFASARLMEVWAHGQDIYDMVGIDRPGTERLRHVCDLGVRTFGWSFTNRGLAVPPRPEVALCSTKGETWSWTGEAGSVTGDARDFALVVTQRRAPEDTALMASGEGAEAWLPIAQCFAGAPQEPAAAGSRPVSAQALI